MSKGMRKFLVSFKTIEGATIYDVCIVTNAYAYAVSKAMNHVKRDLTRKEVNSINDVLIETIEHIKDS